MHEVLAEVPARELSGPRSEVLVERTLVLAGPGGLLREHREVDVVTAAAELPDLTGRTGLLAAEVVARDADHHEALVLPSLRELLEARVLAGEAAATGDVDHEDRLALPVLHLEGLALERRRLDVEHGLVAPLLLQLVRDRHGLGAGGAGQREGEAGGGRDDARCDLHERVSEGAPGRRQRLRARNTTDSAFRSFHSRFPGRSRDEGSPTRPSRSSRGSGACRRPSRGARPRGTRAAGAAPR